MKAFDKAWRALWQRHPLPSEIVVAVSGGVDSMVLLSLVVKKVSPSQIIVAHFNHRLRGKASDLDEFIVKKAAKKLGARFARGEGKGQKASEAFLRRERRRFLKNVANPDGVILTAHHADDQLETLLMRIVRGTGLEGLRAISQRRGRFVRPLLHIPRSQIRAYAKANHIEFRNDASNKSSQYFRNRIRREITPLILREAQSFGGESAFFGRLEGLTQEIESTVRQLKRKSQRSVDRHCIATPYWHRAPRDFLTKSPIEERRRRLRAILRRLTPIVPTRAGLERLLNEIKKGARRSYAPGEILMEQSCGFVFFQNSAQREALRSARPPRLIADRLEASAVGLVAEVKFAGDLYARSFQPGDRQQGKKLKERLLEARIPAPERALLPLLVKAESAEAVWFFPQPSALVSNLTVSFPFTFLSKVNES